MHKTIVVTPPRSEPVSLNEAKKQLRVTACNDDEHISNLIKVSRDRVEKFCNRFFTTQTVDIVYDSSLPDKYICLPYPDLESVEQLSYYDSYGVEGVIPNTDYTFNSETQRITASTSFPVDAISFRVRVVTGAPADFQGAKIAMLMTIADLFDLRVESVVGFSVSNNPAAVNNMWPYRVELGV